MIKKWVLKAIVQKTISYMPMSNKINYFFQKYVTKGVYLNDEYFYDRLGHAKEHLTYYTQNSGKSIPDTCLEIGTGWYPIVPVCFFLAGSNKVYSVDISFLTSKERMKTTLSKIMECQQHGKLKEYVAYQPSRLEVLQKVLTNFETMTLEEMLSQLNIQYLIEDARKLSLPDNSIDLVNSNNTFEHIYPSILSPILKEFDRVVKKSDGVMSHFIDMSDHFAHFDKTINIYNFLRFTESEWSLIDNSIQPQSRLRMSEYEKMYAELSIHISHKTFREGRLNELKTIPLASPYKEMELESVAISHCHFVTAYQK